MCVLGAYQACWLLSLALMGVVKYFDDWKVRHHTCISFCSELNCLPRGADLICDRLHGPGLLQRHGVQIPSVLVAVQPQYLPE